MAISTTVDVSLWKTQLNKIVTAKKERLNKTVEKVVERLLERIISYTPVGDPKLWHPPYWPANYIPGKLKASWKLEKNGTEITIYNDQPYALRVEFGWSTQAPEGMMRRAIKEYPILIGRTAAEYKV
jgi:hypothetical protein